MPGVSAAVCGVEVRVSEVEVVAVRIACVDAEVPETAFPPYRAIEIGSCAECGVLPVEEDVPEVGVANGPASCIHVVVCVNAQEIVEVYLIYCLVLHLVEVEFVSHLVSKEQSLCAGLFVTHGICRCNERAHESDDCDYILLHSRMGFMVNTLSVVFF